LLTARTPTPSQTSLHHPAENAHHLGGVLKGIIIHPFLCLVHLPDTQSGQATRLLGLVQAIVHVSHILDFDGQPDRVRSRQKPLGEFVGLSKGFGGKGSVVLQRKKEGRRPVAVVQPIGVRVCGRDRKTRRCACGGSTSDRPAQADGGRASPAARRRAACGFSRQRFGREFG
jgi:hypothetical protein